MVERISKQRVLTAFFLVASGVLFGQVIHTAADPMPVGADADADTVPDDLDNCVVVPNLSQFDADGDSIGNPCDADLNNDCIVNATDLGLFRSVFFSTDEAADLNEDGIVNALDLGIFRAAFFAPPGPSGLQDICDPVDETPPSIPTGLSATASGSNANLSWNPSSDAGGSGLAGYRVFRNGLPAGETSDTSFVDGDLPEGSYSYRVRAFDGAGNESGLSASASVFINDIDLPPLSCSEAATPSECFEADLLLNCCEWTGSACVELAICP